MQKRSDLWLNDVKSHKECKKLAADYVEITFDNLVQNALNSNKSFAYEGHFTNDATWSIPIKFKEAGYKIHLIFFGLTDIALSEIRVLGRAKEGGHYVDPLTLVQNFYGNLEKLDKYYSIFDSVQIIDTSSIEHIGLAILKNGKCISSIAHSHLPNWFKQHLKNITLQIIEFENHITKV